MGELFKIFGVGVICAVVALILRGMSGMFSDTFKICSSLILCGLVIAFASPLVEFLFEISESSQVNTYLTVMLKGLAVAFLTHICADTCRSCGEVSVGGYIELAGKIQLLIISLPLLREVIGVARELVEMI